MDLISHPSPNFDERPQGQKIDLIVLHYRWARLSVGGRFYACLACGRIIMAW